MPTSGPPGRAPGRTAPGTEKKRAFSKTDGGNTRKTHRRFANHRTGPGTASVLHRSSNSNRLYATVEAVNTAASTAATTPVKNWQLMNPDERLWGRGNDFAEVKADPKMPTSFIQPTSLLEKRGCRKTWSAFRGRSRRRRLSPHLDQSQRSQDALIATDQDAIITVNGGETFSSWYNPTNGAVLS